MFTLCISTRQSKALTLSVTVFLLNVNAAQDVKTFVHVIDFTNTPTQKTTLVNLLPSVVPYFREGGKKKKADTRVKVGLFF